jgi:iron(III) transport system ATP-binding protein
VAEFIGEANFFDGKVIELRDNEGRVEIPFPERCFTLSSSLGVRFQKGEEVTLCVRPEDIELSPLNHPPDKDYLEGEVSQIHFMGNYTDCRIKVVEEEVKVRSAKFQPYKKGDGVFLRVEPEKCIAIKKG